MSKAEPYKFYVHKVTFVSKNLIIVSFKCTPMLLTGMADCN